MAKSFKLQLVETLATLMTAAFGMVAALAWNEAIKAAVKEFFGEPDALAPMFVYAVTVTVIAVIFIILIARSLGRLRDSIAAEEEAAKKAEEAAKKKTDEEAKRTEEGSAKKADEEAKKKTDEEAGKK